jgi:gamma-glutamyltranspeptidase/glutathione hydrolase
VLTAFLRFDASIVAFRRPIIAARRLAHDLDPRPPFHERAAAVPERRVARLGAVAASQPEPPSGWTPKTLATAKKYMVAAAHPLAVDAGLAMLDRGGTAVDAMIATQLVLNQVEPSSSGIGGGAYLVYFDARAKKVVAIDGRETAPSGATAQLLVGADGKALAFQAARVGGRAVGVPGTAKLLEVAHARHGKLPWKTLFEPAIRIAEDGFAITPRVVKLMGADKGLADDPAVKALYFNADGTPKAAGTVIRNPAFAATLRALADEGADAFYLGDIARDLVATVRGHRNPGSITLEDLARIACGTWSHSAASIGRNGSSAACRPRPPAASRCCRCWASSSVTTWRRCARARPRRCTWSAEAGRLAFADRNKYVGDDRFVEVPVNGSSTRAMSRAARAHPRGEIDGRCARRRAARDQDRVCRRSPRRDRGHHPYLVVDGEGNALSMTTTIESNNGSRVMVRGFLLNNELTDFDFVP